MIQDEQDEALVFVNQSGSPQEVWWWVRQDRRMIQDE
jgi:hypothetical protein